MTTAKLVEQIQSDLQRAGRSIADAQKHYHAAELRLKKLKKQRKANGGKGSFTEYLHDNLGLNLSQQRADVLRHSEGQAMNQPLQQAIKKAGGKAALARKIGVSAQALGRWTRVPPIRVLGVEAATGIRREVLRPDIYPPKCKKAAFNEERLRFPRALTARVLSCSIATVQRMEKRGLLTVLRDSPNGAVFHPSSQVRALAGEVV
jgi:DNA-binding transcriptional regulator YdaS (Cro superfamily)